MPCLGLTKSELSQEDSNLYKQNQNLLCYHYTIGQSRCLQSQSSATLRVHSAEQFPRLAKPQRAVRSDRLGRGFRIASAKVQLNPDLTKYFPYFLLFGGLSRHFRNPYESFSYPLREFIATPTVVRRNPYDREF